MYKIYKFRFETKKPKLGFAIYARNEKIACEIIDIINEESTIKFYKPRFKRFKKVRYIDHPPFEIEQEQYESALKSLEKRIKLKQQQQEDEEQ